MIQDIHPHRFSNEFVISTGIQENDYIFHFRGNSLLLKQKGESIEIPRKKDFPDISEQSKATFLFRIDNIPCFLVWDELKSDILPFVYKEIGFFRTLKQHEIAWVSVTAFHLLNWYVQNRFCGKCGAAMVHKVDERAMLCTECHTVVYPKISPAIIVAIINRDQLLLARNANFKGGWYSLIAGYVDIGETLEETVVREVKEEVGLDVKNIRYYKSQPWALSGSMMIGFIAEADSAQPIAIDNNEIVEAAWFSRRNLPPHPPSISISGELIEKFARGEL